MDNSNDKKVESYVYVIVGLVSIGCILLSVYLHTIWSKEGDDEHFFRHLIYLFISELGVAGIVALLIISTIEKFTRNKHEKAAKDQISTIKENLFYAIYRRHIPPEVFSEVERCLLLKDIIRRDYSIEYDLSPLEEEEIGSPSEQGHLL